jgi:hypothetical protein
MSEREKPEPVGQVAQGEFEDTPRAWLRRWVYEGQSPGTRGCRPKGWMFKDVTETKLMPDDVPLYARRAALRTP